MASVATLREQRFLKRIENAFAALQKKLEKLPKPPATSRLGEPKVVTNSNIYDRFIQEMEAMQKNDGVEQLAAEFSGLSISHTASPDTINDTNPTRQRTDDPLSLTSTSNRYPTCEKKKKDIQDAAHLQLSQPPNQAPLARGSNENAASLPASGEYPTVDTGLRKDTVSDKRGSRVQSQVLSGMVTAADVPSEQSPAGSKAELASCCSICKRELKENIAHTIEKGTIVCRDCFERPKEEEIGVRKQCMNCKKVDLTRTRKRNGEYRCTNCKSFFDRNGYERPESIYAKGTMEGYANLECHHCHLHQTKHNFTGYWYPAGDGKNYICQNCRRYLKMYGKPRPSRLFKHLAEPRAAA